MALIQSKYSDVVQLMAPGDVIAFGGHHPFSDIIKKSSNSTVSHVALVKTAAQGGQDARSVQSVMRLDQPKLSLGVTEDPCADILKYVGDVWWLPMRADLRANAFDAGAFTTFLDQKKKALFDPFSGAYVIMLGVLKQLQLSFPQLKYDELDFMCCSEFVAAALKKAKLAPNADQNVTSPADVCIWEIYGPDYHQLVGNPTAIPHVNSVQPQPKQATGGPRLWVNAFVDWVREQFRRLGRNVPAQVESGLDNLLKQPGM